MAFKNIFKIRKNRGNGLPSTSVGGGEPQTLNRTNIPNTNVNTPRTDPTPNVLMYQATLRNDWADAEKALKNDPNLVWDELSTKGDRALHLAAMMNHKEFIKKLVELMSEEHLLLHDGYGYTAFCYVAISGLVDVAAIIREKNGSVVGVCTNNNLTPIYLAALHGNKGMVSYLRKFTRREDLSTEEWFDLLLATIRARMYDVALKIVEMNVSLATMANEDGTSLHLLAQQRRCTSVFEDYINRLHDTVSRLPWLQRMVEKYLMGKRVWFVLVEKLWTEILKLEPANARELIKKPPILLEAAKVGNIELITKLARNDPSILWDTDDNGYTIFHIAILYRQESLFRLIHRVGTRKNVIAITTDEDGNNILHLAGKLAHPSRRNIVPEPTLQMKRELSWFKEVEGIVPPYCLKMKNKEGYTPRELFSKEHKSLLEESKTWIKDTSNSYMLVTIIMITMVFSASISVPGGFNEETGVLILYGKTGFNYFLGAEAFAMFCSILAIIIVWAILTSSFREDDFWFSLPTKLTSLVFFREEARLEHWIAIIAVIALILTLNIRWFKLFFDTYYSEYWLGLP